MTITSRFGATSTAAEVAAGIDLSGTRAIVTGGATPPPATSRPISETAAAAPIGSRGQPGQGPGSEIGALRP